MPGGPDGIGDGNEFPNDGGAWATPLYPVDSVGQAMQAQAMHEAERESLLGEVARLREELDSMDRAFARAITKVALAEQARDDARAECDSLLEKLREYRGIWKGGDKP